MNHEDEIKDYERRLQGMSDAIVQKDANASKLRAEIDSLRLTNQRLEAEVERMKELDGLLSNLRNLTAIPPRGIKYEEGVMILDYVQRDLLPKWEQSRLRSLESRGEQKGEK